MEIVEPILQKIIDDVAEQGWSVNRHFFKERYLNSLLTEVQEAWRRGNFQQAGIGSGAERQFKPEIRSDYVIWLDPENLTPLQRIYWEKIDALRLLMNRELYLGLGYLEAHLAVYPPGSFYKKHLDQFRNVKYRLISCILYLNFSWNPSDGGQLRIYSSDGTIPDQFIDVNPEAGTFVCFRSDTVYHEVLPCSRARFSLAGWLRKTS